MNFLLKGAIKMLAPQLEKVPEGLASISEYYGVKDAFIIIGMKESINDKGISVKNPCAMVMHMGNNTMTQCLNKDGSPAEFTMEQALALMMGEMEGDDDL